MNEELKNHIVEMLKKGVRLDGRGAEDYRQPLKVDYNISESAEGSAQVTLGETMVMVGIKLAVESPYPDTPDQGNLMVGAEFSPLANPNFELGPPGIEAVELGRVVDRGIREAKAIDLKKLCITPGEKVWTVSIDICPINDAGNLFDTSALAAIAALKNTRFPKLSEEGVIDYSEKTDENLPLLQEPVEVTVLKIEDQFLVDPTLEEEIVYDARLTAAFTDDGKLCAIQKGGVMPLTTEEIMNMVDIAQKKSEELRKAL